MTKDCEDAAHAHGPNPKSFTQKDPWLKSEIPFLNSERGARGEKVIESATESRKKVYLPSANPGDTPTDRQTGGRGRRERRRPSLPDLEIIS